MLKARLQVAAFLILVMLGCAFAPVAISNDDAASGPKPAVLKLAENVYGFVGVDGETNSGFVVTNEGVVVIDAQGPARLARLLLDSIRAVTDKPVIYVINTHYHGDHTFGNQYFAPSHRIIAHEATRKNLIERDPSHRERFKRFFGEESLDGFILTPPGITVTDKMKLEIGGEVFELIHPGIAHTDGDIYVHLPQKKILFAGDLVYKERLPLLGEGNSFDWLKALDALLELGEVVCLPGHGAVGDKGAISAFKGYLTALHAEVARLKAEGLDMEAVKKTISLPEYSSHTKYSEWLPQNAEAVYKEMEARK